MAQGTGTIYGTVTDPSGSAVPSAQIEAVSTERGTTRKGSSGPTGDYVFSAMPIGTYLVRVSAGGFRQFARAVTLDANQNVRADVSLLLGNTTESVTVTSEAPIVDSRSAVMGTLLNDRQLVDLPTNGRNIISLAALLPGVTDITAPQTFTGDRSGPTVSMAGTRSNSNLFLFDGQDFAAAFRNTGLNYPPPDALQEVNVLTSSFSAEYGHNGGGVFNVVTKSGTNQVHGAVWEFVRNSDFNARNFFSATNTQNNQNQFGAAAGGPIKKDKLFVFGSYEGLRIRQAPLTSDTFPLTAAERVGDFSGQKPITDPTTGQPFPGNQIPTSRFDPVSAAILSHPGFMPLPNAAGNALIASYNQPQNNDQGLIRVDYNLGANHVISGRYNHNYATQNTIGGSVPAYETVFNFARVQSATASDTWTPTPNLVNEFRLGYNRFTPSYRDQNGFSLHDLGGNFPVLNNIPLPPAITISSPALSLGTSSAVNGDVENEDYQVKDTIHYVRGKHSLTAGFETFRRRYLNRDYYFTMGQFSFTGAISGNAQADFLLGKPATETVAFPLTEQGGIQNSFNEFVQDDWRVTKRLTLNLGLRYELPMPWYQPQNYWATFRQGQQSTVFPGAPAGLVFYGDKNVPRGMVPTDTTNFAPRFGFAYDVFGDGRTSLRGGYGIFYDQIPADLIQNFSQPFRNQSVFNAPYSLSDPLRGQPSLPLSINLSNPTFVGTPSFSFPDPYLRTPYVQQVNLSIEREVLHDTMVDAAYVGKFGRSLLDALDINPAVYRPGETLATENNYRMIRGFADLVARESGANSSYDGLQVKVTKRLSHNFSAQGAYTFSKAIDQSSGITAANTNGQAPMPYNLRAERGLATFNAAHIASMSWIYDLPALRRQPAAVHLIAGGWEWNGFLTLRTGEPLTPVVSGDTALSGTPSQRPNVVGNMAEPSGRTLSQQIAQWFNPAAFATPLTGTFGNAGRDIIIAPGNATVNAALFKSFPLPLHEGMKIQFRSEFFNVLNRVNLGNPNVTVGSSMGRITAAGPARVLQLALKVVF